MGCAHWTISRSLHSRQTRFDTHTRILSHIGYLVRSSRVLPPSPPSAVCRFTRVKQVGSINVCMRVCARTNFIRAWKIQVRQRMVRCDKCTVLSVRSSVRIGCVVHIANPPSPCANILHAMLIFIVRACAARIWCTVCPLAQSQRAIEVCESVYLTRSVRAVVQSSRIVRV